MKKILITITAILCIAGILAACTQGNNKPETTTAGSTAESTSGNTAPSETTTATTTAATTAATTATTASAVTAPQKTEKGNALRWVINPSISTQSLATYEGERYYVGKKHMGPRYPDYNAYVYPFGVIVRDGKYGIVGLDGEIKVAPTYTGARACFCTEKFLLVMEETQLFEVNDDLTVSEYNGCAHGGEPDYSYIYADEKLVEVLCEYAYAYSDAAVEYCVAQKGKLDPMWSQAEKDNPFEAEATLKYILEKPFAVMRNGKAVTSFQYKAHGKFSQELVALQNAQGKWGYVDKNGKEIVPFLYDAETYTDSEFPQDNRPARFCEGFVPVCKDGKWGYYNSQGKLVVPLIYEGATNVVNGRCFVKENGKWGVAALG